MPDFAGHPFFLVKMCGNPAHFQLTFNFNYCLSQSQPLFLGSSQPQSELWLNKKGLCSKRDSERKSELQPQSSRSGLSLLPPLFPQPQSSSLPPQPLLSSLSLLPPHRPPKGKPQPQLPLLPQFPAQLLPQHKSIATKIRQFMLLSLLFHMLYHMQRKEMMSRFFKKSSCPVQELSPDISKGFLFTLLRQHPQKLFKQRSRVRMDGRFFHAL